MSEAANIENLVSIIATVLLLLVGVISVGGFFPDFDWRLAWYSNPRPHLMIAACIALAWFGWQRNRLFVLLSIGLVAVNLVVLVPLFLSPAGKAAASQSFSLLHLSTNKGEALLGVLADFDANVFFLQEVTPEIDVNLGQLFPQYRVS